MSHSYAPVGHDSNGSAGRSPPFAFQRYLRPRYIVPPIAFGALLLALTVHPDDGYAAYIPSQLSGLWGPAPEAYEPGVLGSRLMARHRQYMGESHDVAWAEYLHGNGVTGPSKSVSRSIPTRNVLGTALRDEMFDLMADRDESQCIGWSPEAQKESEEGLNAVEAELELEGLGGDVGRRRRRVVEKRGKWDNCWKAKMWNQIEAWEWTEPFKQNPELLNRNTQSLTRLRRCLLQSAHSPLPTYPPNEHDLISEDLANITGTDWIEARECSLTSTKVVLGNWWYFLLAYSDPRATSGEAVWIRNQIEALYEQGYTVLCGNGYDGMIQIHNAMPDVISQIWTEDRHILACQDDPRCIDYSTFRPTTEKYAVQLDEHGEPTQWNQMRPEGVKQKWVWSEEDLRELPVDQRGTIPQYKLFAVTYWGARPGDPYWLFTDEDFWWNALGQQWTLTPFDYPHHTYIPYSIEKECEQTAFHPHSEKEDHLFVLAKRTVYFEDPGSAIPEAFWATLEEQTGLTTLSVAVDDERKPGEEAVDVPLGVKSVGKVSKPEFEELVGKSKLMLGIGKPLISPSVYSALCQGTPVVVPYFKGIAVPKGWDLFHGAYSQHGPAAAIGAPYVYSYDYTNETMLVDVVRTAASTPIGRYIPPDMTHAAELKNMDDLMRFNWKEHARLSQTTDNTQTSDLRRIVIGRCFEIGRCEPLYGALQ